MLSLRKTIGSIILILSLIISSRAAVAASAEQYSDTTNGSAEYMAIDLIAARPVGFVAMVGGAVVFLVSWPFSALGGNSDEAWNTLVAAPAQYTFNRPLGNFHRQAMTADN